MSYAAWMVGALSRATHCLGGFGPTCRFTPSCSHYLVLAIEEHGLAKGVCLGVARLARCSPFNKNTGWDPVPTREATKGQIDGK